LRDVIALQIENSAKAVIVKDGMVLLIRYLDSSEMGLGTWYALPGGRQRPGETLHEALQRECAEEIGTKVRVGELLFVREYVHARHELAGKGRDQHKVEFMFVCELEDAAMNTDTGDVDQASIEWVGVEQLADLNIFPRRLRQLADLGKGDAEQVYWGDEF
jgi:ADP-ribose pyrophosphatase YjhB (NUDIX family)